MHAAREIAPDFSVYIEAVHRLSDLGAVYTDVTHGTSQEGFEAEWRMIQLDDGRRRSDQPLRTIRRGRHRCRARPVRRTAPAGGTAGKCRKPRWSVISPHFAARDWDAMAEMLAEDFCTADRRRVVNAGVVRGRDVEMANLRAIADVGIEEITSTAIATRGERLVLNRTSFSVPDWPDELNHEVIDLVEITADNRGSVHVVFDPDDIDAAFDELDARYLAGEAAEYAHTWSVIIHGHAAFNRREYPATTPDWVNLDHRRGRAFAPGDLFANWRAAWDLVPDIRIYIEAVHRLSALGAVVTHGASGSSQEGFDAEWREIDLLTLEGDLFSRSEIFDEADLDAALARFDELSRPAPQLENTASRAHNRFQAGYAARDWDAVAEIFADDICTDDRRRVVNAGLRHGRDAAVAWARATADVGTQNVTSTVIATRGERLQLTRARYSGRDHGTDAFLTEVLVIAEINADNRIAAIVVFDLDDIKAALEELDARYLVGEAAAHSHTWSVIAQTYAALSRQELPATTPDWVNIDHRRITKIEAGGLAANIRAAWEHTPDATVYIEAVHRLSTLGAVVTRAINGTSQEGFDAEWREIDLLTFDGDLINRIELFDEADIDDALARFDELNRRRRGWKTRQAESLSASRRASRPATGMPWRRYWPTTSAADDRRRL